MLCLTQQPDHTGVLAHRHPCMALELLGSCCQAVLDTTAQHATLLETRWGSDSGAAGSFMPSLMHTYGWQGRDCAHTPAGVQYLDVLLLSRCTLKCPHFLVLRASPKHQHLIVLSTLLSCSRRRACQRWPEPKVAANLAALHRYHQRGSRCPLRFQHCMILTDIAAQIMVVAAGSRTSTSNPQLLGCPGTWRHWRVLCRACGACQGHLLLVCLVQPAVVLVLQQWQGQLASWSSSSNSRPCHLHCSCLLVR